MSHSNTDEINSLDPGWLFAYGTLGPGGRACRSLGPWEPDAVRGRLFDLGPYPGLVDLDHPSAQWVEGHARPVSRSELIDLLDPYEGVSVGLYRREAVRSRSGRIVWVYVYNQPLPSSALGPLVRWDGMSGA